MRSLSTYFFCLCVGSLLSQTNPSIDPALDCLLPPSALELEKGFGTTASISHWPDQVLPYEIWESIGSQENRVKSAIGYINRNTNVCILPRGNQAAYVSIRPNGGGNVSTASSIGFRGDMTHVIRLSQAAQRSTVIHEFNHILGLFHEHQRPDRDSFIQIRWENITPAYQYAFEIIDLDSVYLSHYDYNSSMHYYSHAFSKNGQATIEHVIPNASLPSRLDLSNRDIETLNAIYPKPLDCDSVYAYNIINASIRVLDDQNSFHYCTGIPVQILGIPIGHTGDGWSWEWDVPDGEPRHSFEQNPLVTFHSPGEKTVIIKVSNHYMEKTFEFTFLIGDKEPSIEIQPNPVSNGTIVAKIGVTASELHIRLVNQWGQVLQNRAIQPKSCTEEVRFDSHGLPQGVYYLMLDDGTQTASARVVIQ